MHSGMIGKIEKAHRYAEERERFAVRSFRVAVRGDNGEHEVTFDGDQWGCGCNFFERHGACAHTMAMERVLEGMIARRSGAAA